MGNKKFSLKPPQPRLIYGRDLPASPEPGSLCFQRLCCILVTQFQTGNLSSLPGGGRELFPWAGGTLLSCGNSLDKGHSCCCSLLWPVPCAVLVDELSHSLPPGIPNGIFPLCPVSRLWLGCLIPGGNRDLICSYGHSSQTQEAAPRLCRTPRCKLQALGFISQPWKYWMCLTMNCCLAGLFWVFWGFFFFKAGPEFS